MEKMIQEEISTTKDEVILIVDDYPYNVTAMEAILCEEGYKNILVAMSGQEALKIVDDKNPDIVLLDIMMPGMDGFEVCSALKNNEETSDISVIMVTAKIPSKDLKRGFDVGAVDYIEKPFDKVELVARVQSVLKLKQSKEEVKQKNIELLSLAQQYKETIDASDDLLNREITKREQEYKKLLETQKNYSAMVELSPDGIMMIQDMNVIFANSRIHEMLNYNKPELVGLPIFDLIPKHQRESLIKKYKDRLDGKGVSSTHQLQFTKKYGEIAWVELNVSLIEYNGKSTILVLIRDTTQGKRSVDTLKKEKIFVESILQSQQDIVFVADLKGRLIQFSDVTTQILGYEKDELLGMPFINVFPPDKLQEIMKLGPLKGLRGEPVPPVELVLQTKSGEQIPVQFTGAPIKDAKGKVIAIIGVGRDLREQKKAEEQLKALFKDLEINNEKLTQSNKDLQDFVYVASHDLREPLRKISAFGDILTDSLEGKLDEDDKENFGFMIDGSKRMQEMVDALLVYSRVSTKEKPFEQVDLAEVISDIKDLELASWLEDVGGTIKVLEPMPAVFADSTQMHQLLQNLIGNGLKYHKKNVPPKVTCVASLTDDGMVRVGIKDNGIGIEKEHYDQVFTMFRRLHSRSEYEGTGIGLSVCKKIVERHGGAIEVESVLGEGTTFWFSIPTLKKQKRS